MSNKPNQYLPQKVQVVLSIPPETVDANIKANLHQIPTWFGDMFYPNGFEAIIVSAGPSMEKYVTEINLKERMEDPNRTFMVFCVKHALPRLMAMGIEPDICVILDGRPFEEESTHGIKRKSLFAKIPKRTVFMIASMSNPGYANFLLAKGARVLGWHTAVDGIRKYQESGQIREVVISGGTSSGTRCIGIAHAMGMRDVTLLGFDSCVHNPTLEELAQKDSKGRQKYIHTDLPIVNPQSLANQDEAVLMEAITDSFTKRGLIYSATLAKRFYTTGELLAQAQDFEMIFLDSMRDMKFAVLDDGLVHHMFTNIPHIPKRQYDFNAYVRMLCPRKDFGETVSRTVAF